MSNTSVNSLPIAAAPVLTADIRDRIIALCDHYPNKRAVVLPALHLVHDAQRQVSIGAIREIAALLELHPSEVHDTMSFYQFFRDEQHPLGRHRLWVCRSLSCMLRGGEELLAELCEKWQIRPGGTSADGKITLEFAECLGACEGAPCLLADETCHLNMTASKVQSVVDQLP